MTYQFGLPLLLALVGGSLLAAQELTPRELFFAAPAIKAKAAAKPGAPKPPRPPAAPQEIAGNTPPKGSSTTPPAPLPPQPVEPSLPRISADIIPASLVSTTPPLGLRYSLLLSRENGPYNEVDASTVFHSGDRLKVTVESNDNAYLYVLNRGSSGLWNVLFPASEVAGGDNEIQAFRRYELPPGGRWYFNEQAGEEKLFVVLSRKPIPNFEDLIYAVQQPAESPSNVRPAGNSAPKVQSKIFQMAALNKPIDDLLINRVRSQLVSRDLVFEKVDDSKPAPGPSRQKESATYVINKNAGPDGKVILDLKLEHK